MKWYNIMLSPFALLYSIFSALRNSLYNSHILREHSASIPTICVGNLAVGGTGKTPFVEYLIQMLQDEYKVAVLSRGYHRKTHGFQLANSDSTAISIGDEPMQIHYKFPHIPVAVCADRLEGIRRLQEAHPEVQVVLLDDAYQHRRLKCGFYILLTAYDRLFIHDHFLPLGRLRDNKGESMRASIVVVTKCPDKMRPIDQRVIDTELRLPSFQQLCFSKIIYPELPTGQRILLVTGVAHPEHLFTYVVQACPTAQLMAYPDHHEFTEKDLKNIANRATNMDLVLTTEKDYVRMMTMQLPAMLAHKLQSIPITISVSNEKDIHHTLCQYINENLLKIK